MQITEKEIEVIANYRWSNKYRWRILGLTVLGLVAAVVLSSLLKLNDFDEWSAFGIGIIPLIVIFVYLLVFTNGQKQYRKQVIKEYREQKGLIQGSYNE